jgi:hypothetical protein
VAQHTLETVAQDDYRAAGEGARVFGQTLSAASVGRLLEREGEKLQSELFGPEASLEAAHRAPANPPQFLILSGDGSRYRTRLADRPRGAAKTALPPDEKRDRGWRENKIGAVIRAEHGSVQPDGQYLPPAELLKTYVATTDDTHAFGSLLRTEFERRGGKECPEVVWVSDHGHGLPELRAREFKDVKLNVVTDEYHTFARLGECARIIKGDTPTTAQDRRRYARKLRNLLDRGKTKDLSRLLEKEAEKRAPRPERLSDLTEQPSAHTLWTHILYIESHQDSMDYPTYRAKGWPVGSGTIESACGQFGERFKHNRMRWSPENANHGHHLKAAILSEDDRWTRRWPPPVPVLDFPAEMRN